ncbi:MAG: hypothetical protein ACTSSI_02505, partial [Candidatus Helarchaeota archaeon]
DKVSLDEFLKVVQALLDTALGKIFSDEYKRFILMKQLLPASGHELIINMTPKNPITVTFPLQPPSYIVLMAKQSNINEQVPSISFTISTLRRFFSEDLDLLRLLNDNEIKIANFEEFNELTVRGILGFPTALFLDEDLKQAVSKELIQALSTMTI